MTDSPLTDTPSSEPNQRDEAIQRLEQDANRNALEFERAQESGSLTDGAHQAREEVKREGSRLANRVSNFAEQRKRSGTDKLERIAGAVERAADDLEKESPETARYVRSAAETVRDFSTSLRDRSVQDLASDARDFARRQPWLVFGGAVLAGLAVTRFLKSSRRDDRRTASYGSDEFGGMR